MGRGSCSCIEITVWHGGAEIVDQTAFEMTIELTIKL